VKIERVSIEQSTLEAEYDIYEKLKGSQYIPNTHWFGTELDHYVLVIDLLGPSLEEVFSQYNQKFNLETVLIFTVQMASVIILIMCITIVYRQVYHIAAVEWIHSCGIIH
jgi:casein kinase 1